MSDEVRLEIGFSGGEGVSIAADNAQWEQLNTALERGEPAWVTINARDDSKYVLSTAKIVFVRVASISRRVGFREV